MSIRAAPKGGVCAECSQQSQPRLGARHSWAPPGVHGWTVSQHGSSWTAEGMVPCSGPPLVWVCPRHVRLAHQRSGKGSAGFAKCVCVCGGGLLESSFVCSQEADTLVGSSGPRREQQAQDVPATLKSLGIKEPVVSRCQSSPWDPHTGETHVQLTVPSKDASAPW